MTRVFKVVCSWGLGDAVMLSALVRDVYLSTDGQTRIWPTQNFGSLWENNPYVAAPTPDAREVNLSHWMGVGAAKSGQFRGHLMRWLYDTFEKAAGVKVPILRPHGDLHLSERERPRVLDGRYWVVVAGHKRDMPVKGWPNHLWADLVARLRGRGVTCVQAGSLEHTHPLVPGALDLRGQTESIRDFFRLIRDCEGVVCGVTGAMHIAAALQRPCVVIAGGREAWTWMSYANTGRATFSADAPPVPVSHRVLHTVGLLACAGKFGCFKDQVQRPKHKHDKYYNRPRCELPVLAPAPYAACMGMISPQHVEDAVVSYYTGGEIPPIVPAESTPLAPAKPPAITVAGSRHASLGGPLPTIRKAAKPAAAVVGPLGHPILGGRMTVLVLCFGDYPALAKRCLQALLKTTDRRTVEVRVAANQCSEPTLEYLRSLPLAKLYVHAANRYKYPVLREMLRDPDAPITTPYFTWFDDDTYATNPKWLDRLCESIIHNHPKGGRLFGERRWHDLSRYRTDAHDPKAWFAEAGWWQKRPLKVHRKSVEAANGSSVEFVVGAFWAMHHATALACDIPCPRLRHNGGDITIGEAIHQGGFKIVDFNTPNKLVRVNPERRRGFEEKFPWKPA